MVILLLAALSLSFPPTRGALRDLVRREPPPRITPLAIVVAEAPAGATPTLGPLMVARPTELATTVVPRSTSAVKYPPSPTLPRPTRTPLPSATPAPVVIGERVYDAYVPAASKEGQAYQYSCEFDAAWVILQTFGIDVGVDELIEVLGVDRGVEPYIEETGQGFVIHGGDITTAFSGDYTQNFLARSSGTAMRRLFVHYGLPTTPVRDRAGVESALRSGALVWMKTTVDFKPWRPAIWRMPDGTTYRTVLGNDHAVVVIGFNHEGVVIRDVLGPTSSNRQRPYEYEVDWPTFLQVWEAQSFDGLAVARSALP
jgi:hypothetical protein